MRAREDITNARGRREPREEGITRGEPMAEGIALKVNNLPCHMRS